MNDDLHNIDHLFRDGIEGHREEVPPSVWEAVSNDLDKKQASYYKSKYYRLKRAALLLLLLCSLGGAYIVYKEAGENKTASSPKHRGSEPATSVTITSPAPHSNQTPVLSTAPKNNEATTENGTRLTEGPSANDTASVSLTTSSKEEEKHEQPYSTRNGTFRTVHQPDADKNAASLLTPATALRVGETLSSYKKGDVIIKEHTTTTKNNKPSTSRTEGKQTASPSSLSLNRFLPFAARDYAVPFINLAALQISNQTIVPQAMASANSKNKTKAAHGFSLSAFAAPNIGFDRLEDDDHLAGPGRNRQEARKQEQDNFSFSGGLLLSYNLNSKISLQSGLTVTSSSTAIAPTTIYAKPDNNGHARYELHCSSGYVYITPKGGVQPTVTDSSAKTSGTTSKLTYVGIPAVVAYRISAGRLSISPAIGLGLNILTSGKTKTNLSNTTGSENATTAISGLKPTYVDGQFGLGVEYGLGKKISIAIRPNARLALTPINKETPVKSYQNYLSVETGVRIKL